MNISKSAFKKRFCSVYNIVYICLDDFLSLYISYISIFINYSFFFIYGLYPVFYSIEYTPFKIVVAIFQLLFNFISKSISYILFIKAVLHIHYCWNDICIFFLIFRKFYIVYFIQKHMSAEYFMLRKIFNVVLIKIYSSCCISSSKVYTQWCVCNF